MINETEKKIIDFMVEYDRERRNGLRKFADEYGIKDIDENLVMELGNVRRPLMLFRGKPVTVEQTMQLITGEEPLFGEGAPKECWFDPRGDRGILKNVFYRPGYHWLDTWVHCDGTIGGNNIFLGKYPEWSEIFPQYMHLAKQYPFLDMVISYTMYNENTCYLCSIGDTPCKGYNEECKCKDCAPYVDKIIYYREIWGESENFSFAELYFGDWDTGHVRSDVGDSVVITIWVHNGRTDILFGDRAADKFKEYNSLYCSPEYAFMFSADLYRYDHTCICDKAFVEDCFEYIGKSRSLCDEYIERKFILPFNENATVVTKEWVIEQYNTYIAGK